MSTVLRTNEQRHSNYNVLYQQVLNSDYKDFLKLCYTSSYNACSCLLQVKWRAFHYFITDLVAAW